MKTTQEMIDEIQLSGVVFVGREHVDGLLTQSSIECPKGQIVAILGQGRSYGIYIYADFKSFNSEILFFHLGRLGFSVDQAIEVNNNVRTNPAPELLNLGDRD